MTRFSRSDRWTGGLVLVLTAVYYVIPWQDVTGGARTIGVFFLFLYSAILPGFILGPRLFPRSSDVIEKAATSTLLGLTWFLLVAFLWALTGLSLGLLQLALPVLLVLTAAWGLWPRGAKWRGGAGTHKEAGEDAVIAPLTRWEKTLLTIFAVFLLCIFVLVFRAGVPLGFTADTLDHVGYVNEIAETQAFFPTTAYYKDPGSNGADLRKGLLHVFYGFSTGYLHLDALGVLTVMNALLAVLLLLTVYATGHMLFGNRAVAVLSAILFLIALDEGLRGSAIRQSFFTHRFGAAFFLFAVTFSLRYLETGRRRNLLPTTLFSFATGATHVFFGVLLVFAWLTILVWKCCFPQNNARTYLSRVVPLGIFVALGLMPFGLYRFFTAYAGTNELHKEIQGVVFITKSLYIADPFNVFKWFGPVGILSFLAVFALWRFRKEHAGLGYVFAAFFTLFAVVFNPILLPPIRGAMTYLIARLNNLVPFYFAAAYFLVAFCTSQNRGFRSRAFPQVLAVLLAFGVLYEIAPVFGPNAFSTASIEKGRANSYLRWNDDLEAIAAALPAGSVVASDPLTSYSVTAFTPFYTVCTFDQHAPPNDVLLEERMRAARDILSPYVPMHRTTALLAEHRATHVILNDRFPADLRLEYWSMNREMYPSMREKFDLHGDAFEKVYENDGFVVYQWNGRVTDVDSVFSSSFILDDVPEGFEWVGKQAGEAWLEGFTLGGENLSPGEPIDVALIWRGRGEYAFRNYVVAIRFDHTDPGLPSGGKPFPKIARKIKEKATGRSYRFSDYHKIRSGFLSPDSWPPGKLVLDETRVHVPPNASPGEYTVTVKLLTLQHQPTYRLKDVVSDKDIYSGIPVARVLVR